MVASTKSVKTKQRPGFCNNWSDTVKSAFQTRASFLMATFISGSTLTIEYVEMSLVFLCVTIARPAAESKSISSFFALTTILKATPFVTAFVETAKRYLSWSRFVVAIGISKLAAAAEKMRVNQRPNVMNKRSMML